MPLLSIKPNEEFPFTYEKFIYLDRVPTASILIRLIKAPKDNNGRPIITSKLPVD
jgi:hypothetical protein